MRKLALAMLFFTLASPAWATTYFLATAVGGGSDSNSGADSGHPWLTPNHTVNCGDVIIAAASTAYDPANFTYYKWGTVTCAAGNNVAWLKCVTFDACKISFGGTWPQQAMWISKSYWGVQGWEATITAEPDNGGNGCFVAAPNYDTPVQIHHIVFANNVVNGCFDSGFTVRNGVLTNDMGVDYVAVVGNIAYNASQGGTGQCGSGISVFQPRQSDSFPGTHYYVAGNFIWDNFNANPCAGGTPSDGEGIIIDSPDGSQWGLSPYTAQIVVDNNILVANGGRGFEVFNNSAGSVHAPIYVRHNTLWGNNIDLNDTNNLCGEMLIHAALKIEQFFNIAATSQATGCGGYSLYAYYVISGDSTDHVYNNVGWSATGTYDGLASSGAFSYGPNNLFETNPSFVNATAPGAPSCGSASSVPNCMATVITNFTPTNAAAKPYGYQIPSTKQTYDPLFPQWLCNVNLPAGLVTMGCLALSSLPASPVITGVEVQ
jgi:hypothetical protein